jgi:hypothetical protein
MLWEQQPQQVNYLVVIIITPAVEAEVVAMKIDQLLVLVVLAAVVQVEQVQPLLLTTLEYLELQIPEAVVVEQAETLIVVVTLRTSLVVTAEQEL